MSAITPQTKADLTAAITEVEGAIAALGVAYQNFLAAYDVAKTEAYEQNGVAGASDIANSFGPGRVNVDIFASMLAHGLEPILQRNAIRADLRPITDLAGAFAGRVG